MTLGFISSLLLNGCGPALIAASAGGGGGGGDSSPTVTELTVFRWDEGKWGTQKWQ